MNVIIAHYSWCPQTRTRVLTNHAPSIVFVLLFNTDLFEKKKERKKGGSKIVFVLLFNTDLFEKKKERWKQEK